MPARGLLLAAAILVGVGAAAQAGALGDLGTYFSGGSAHASRQRSHQLETVAGSWLKGAILDHVGTGETSSAEVRTVRRVVAQLGPVRRVARIQLPQGTFTWYAATTSDQGVCVTTYRDARLYAYECTTAPHPHSYVFDVEPSGWGGGIVALEAAMPANVAHVRVDLAGGRTLSAHMTHGFAMLIFRQPGRPFVIRALDGANHTVARATVNDPRCLSMTWALAPGFSSCVAVSPLTGAGGAWMGWQDNNSGGGGSGPAHVSLFPGFTMRCWVKAIVRDQRVSSSCQRAWRAHYRRPMYDKPPPPVHLDGLSPASCWRIRGSSDYGPAVAIRPARIAVSGESPNEMLAGILARMGEGSAVAGGRVGDPPRSSERPGRRPALPAGARWLYLTVPSVDRGPGEARSQWEATLVAGALRDEMCASRSRPLVAWTGLRPDGAPPIRNGYVEPYPFAQWFQSPPIARLRSRLTALGRRNGFTVVSVTAPHPLQVAPEIVIHTTDARGLLSAFNRIGAAVGIFRTASHNPDVYPELYEGYSIEAVDAHGPFLFVGVNARGTQGAVTWVRAPLRLPSNW